MAMLGIHFFPRTLRGFVLLVRQISLRNGTRLLRCAHNSKTSSFCKLFLVVGLKNQTNEVNGLSNTPKR